jgi:ketosteroid isomerase-like protein
MPFDTPQDAEDAFYDALEGGDAEAMARVWESSAEIACLLPMTPLIQGPEVLEMWRSMFAQGAAFDIQVRHLSWVEGGDLALHLIEERIAAPPDPASGRPGQPVPPVYGSNLFRRGADGWRLVVHQNSPAPPPPGSAAPGPARV